MKDCRSTEAVRHDGAHLAAQLCDMLEIDGYELLGLRMRGQMGGEKATC